MLQLKSWLQAHRFTVAVGLLLLVYLFTRLISLTLLPVFADEAIYIYWAQLTLSEPERYLFYPLNDGKTPLFIWLLIPLLRFFSDPLFAGRFLSVLFGVCQVCLTIQTTALFTKRHRYQLLAGLLVIFMPGLILNNRLSLMDTASTFWVTACFYTAYRSCQLSIKRHRRLQSVIVYAVISGLCFGLALLTKFSNILLLPVLASLLLYFWPTKPYRNRQYHQFWLSLFHFAWPLALTVILGSACLLALKISPAFSQLFARGGDFLYSLSDFFAHPFTIIWANLRQFTLILGNYLGWPFFILSLVVAGLVWSRTRQPVFLLVSAFAFLLPMLLLGKVIYPRYLLPALPFFAISLSVGLSHWSFFTKRTLSCLVLAILLLPGLYFSVMSWTAPAHLPLIDKDKEQLLREWSAGYGIAETVALLETLSRATPTLVLTEGHIGTLPDGLQIYFYNRPSRNQLRIEGIGQPIHNFNTVSDLFADYQQVVLVANSHRLQLDDDVQLLELLAEYPRPLPDSPSLQVWRVK